jgi:phage tail-like protein
MATGKRNDPYLISSYRVEIDGVDRGAFQKCAGLKTETEIFELREGGENEVTHKLVGATKHSNIVLTQGFTSDPALFKWRDEIHNGNANKIKRRNGAIIALGDDGTTEVGRWNFEKAWPVRWEMGEFDAHSGQTNVEMLELAVHRITKAK